jgi:hypothetical protein
MLQCRSHKADAMPRVTNDPHIGCVMTRSGKDRQNGRFGAVLAILAIFGELNTLFQWFKPLFSKKKLALGLMGT